MQIDVMKLSQLIGAIMTIWGCLWALFSFIKSNARQDIEIRKIKQEQKILIEAQLACLDGLHQLGANGPVTNMIFKMEQHMINASHDE